MSAQKPTQVLIAALVAACLCILPLEAQERGDNTNNSSTKIAAALQEMRTTSKQLVALRTEEYRVGQIGVPELMEAHRQLLDVELRLAITPADRIKVLSQQLQLAKDVEDTVTAQYKNGMRAQGDVLQARITRLQIEVLIAEQSK